MKEGKKKQYFRFTRKCSGVEDLFYSRNNKVAVEEMLWIYDQTKLLMLRHGECNELMGEEDQAKNEKWSDMVDEQIFTFKRKVHR